MHNGIDCKTGQPFVEVVMPKWIWVFWAIYIADFFLFLGGALGGAINAAASYRDRKYCNEKEYRHRSKSNPLYCILCNCYIS